MMFLMLSSEDSKIGKGHIVWILHPKCKTAICFPYKNLPTFFQTVSLGAEGGDVILKNTSYRDLSEFVCQILLCP